MKIPFALPLIDQEVINEMIDTLTNTGWITTGPKVARLEEEIRQLTQCPAVICVNSWVSGAMLLMRWFGIGPGDEVIVPAYTYSATALSAMNIGARVVMVDIGEDFNIDVKKVRAAITPRTKAIIPVDLGGWPCDYDQLTALVEEPEVRALFKPASENQEKMGRILIFGDAAHSIGATYRGRQSGNIADAAAFSFHSVKNITTGEGGAVCLNLPEPFDNEEEYRFLKAFALNGQTKSAFEKNQAGGWRYDIIAQGMKVNMPDLCASVGLAQIRRYLSELLPERRRIFEYYNEAFASYGWAQLPPFDNKEKTSSCHLYPLRLRGVTERERDEIIARVSEKGVGVNVHYIPMPMLTLFKSLGYRIADYPNAFDAYSREISLPIYNGLTEKQLDYVVRNIVEAYDKVMEIPESVKELARIAQLNGLKEL